MGGTPTLELIGPEVERLGEGIGVELDRLGGEYIGGRLSELEDTMIDVEAPRDVDGANVTDVEVMVMRVTEVVAITTTTLLEVDEVEEDGTTAGVELIVLIRELVIAELLVVGLPVEMLLATMGIDVDDDTELDTGAKDDGGVYIGGGL
jgi:hypothetical protein